MPLRGRTAATSETVHLTLLEHINLNVPCEATARAFYVDGLGGVVNPRSSNSRQLHINVGASQFHLPHRLSVRGMEPVEAAQVWAGHTELWTVEDLGELHSRLPGAELVGAGDALHIRCQCPWGNRLEVRRAPEGFAPVGAHAGGWEKIVAMPRIVHLVRPGMAPCIAAFWVQIIGCDAATAPGRCSVAFASVESVESAESGAGQQLVFEESAAAPPRDAYDVLERHAYHLAFYLPTAAAFRAAFEAAAAAGLLYANARFEGGPPEFASAMTWPDAHACGQFRVKELRGAAPSDEVGLVLELEVRAPTHVSCPLGRSEAVP